MRDRRGLWTLVVDFHNVARHYSLQHYLVHVLHGCPNNHVADLFIVSDISLALKGLAISVSAAP